MGSLKWRFVNIFDKIVTTVSDNIESFCVKAGLVPTDKVNVFWEIIDDDENELKSDLDIVLEKYTKFMCEKVSLNVIPKRFKSENVSTIINEISEVCKKRQN